MRVAEAWADRCFFLSKTIACPVAEAVSALRVPALRAFFEGAAVTGSRRLEGVDSSAVATRAEEAAFRRLAAALAVGFFLTAFLASDVVGFFAAFFVAFGATARVAACSMAATAVATASAAAAIRASIRFTAAANSSDLSSDRVLTDLPRRVVRLEATVCRLKRSCHLFRRARALRSVAWSCFCVASVRDRPTLLSRIRRSVGVSNVPVGRLAGRGVPRDDLAMGSEDSRSGRF